MSKYKSRDIKLVYYLDQHPDLALPRIKYLIGTIDGFSKLQQTRTEPPFRSLFTSENKTQPNG